MGGWRTNLIKQNLVTKYFNLTLAEHALTPLEAHSGRVQALEELVDCRQVLTRCPLANIEVVYASFRRISFLFSHDAVEHTLEICARVGQALRYPGILVEPNSGSYCRPVSAGFGE